AEELGQAPRKFSPQPVSDSRLVDELARRAGFLRARKLYDMDLRWFGNAEWSWALRGMDDKTLRAAAELGRRWGLLDRMIASSERIRGGIDLAQQFPMPYQDLLTRDASTRDLDPAWVYGLIRQESRFIQRVYSRTGAIGLMQLMPSTARYVAHRMGMTAFRPDHVSDVETNLKLGTEYLKLVYDDQGGMPLLASAAYNAGPHAVRRWRASLTHPVSGALFAEAIPVEE
uniref:lytic transglycosylase domain-containing protein n=1 Tax=Trichlorobacter lovleyi TaxID=313985 RepID=UPI0023F45A46